MSRTNKAFTLLELLAAVTLLVILGTMLFEIFGQSSTIVRISNARQEVFQYARAALEFIERELTGAFVSADADTSSGIKGMQIYNETNSDTTHPMGVPQRVNSQGIFFSTGIIARDTREQVGGSPNPFYGYDVNVARVAYYLIDDIQNLATADLFRAELYDLTAGTDDLTAGTLDLDDDPGSPFVRNCLDFTIDVLDHTLDPPVRRTTNWDSDADRDGNASNGRQGLGLPRAVYVQMRITDRYHATLYRWGQCEGKDKWYVPGPAGENPVKDHWGDEDPVVQTFSQVVYYGQRSN